MKRRDTFMLALSAFILTNCASYFVVSDFALSNWVGCSSGVVW